MSFGSNLENLRKQKGWSQDKLADKLHISRQAISKWENGTSKPDIDNVKSISNIFSIGIDELLDNELPDRAAKLDVEKEEKKENVIQVIKYMIIAVVLIYLISVIGKFISLLTIVNGIQKYANLDNYHYVITTYEDNEIIEKEECWFLKGISKTTYTKFQNNDIVQNSSINIDYNNYYGYYKDNIFNTKSDLDVSMYLNSHTGYEQGKQIYYKFPSELQKEKLSKSLVEILISDDINIKYLNEVIEIETINEDLIMARDTLLPIVSYTFNKENVQNLSYSFEFNSIEEIKI